MTKTTTKSQDEVLLEMLERIARIETVLYKLALHLGLLPRSGTRLCDDD